MTLHDLFTLLILPIATSGTIKIIYMKYISKYINTRGVIDLKEPQCFDKAIGQEYNE